MLNVPFILTVGCAVFLWLTPWGHSAEPIPPADRIDPLALNWAVRATVARGVAYLTNRAATDSNAWIVPPLRTRRHVGYTNVVRRYSEKPTPLYEYEYYTVYERRPGADSQAARTLKPVRRRRVKRVIDPEGGPKRLVPDRNGSIVRETRVRVYDQTGPDRWPHGAMGQNAMALYALRRAGMPADDLQVSSLDQGLGLLVDDFGPPDHTWDLAWMTAAFARMPGKVAEELTQTCATKLLDGQVLEGDARGLWGPVCVNVPLLAFAYNYEQELATLKTKADLAAKEKPDNNARQATAIDAGNALLAFQRSMRRISNLALAFDHSDHPIVRVGDPDLIQIETTGHAHYIFNQTSADLECTALALFALNEAAAAGRLPEETWRPRLYGNTRLRPPPVERADAVLARTAHALARLQNRAGGWHACNLHLPINDFDYLGEMLPGIPVDPKTFVPLPSPASPLTILQGYASYYSIGSTVGFQKALGRFRANFARGLAAARHFVAKLPDYDPKAEHGGRTDPYDSAFYSLPTFVNPGTLQREQQQDWMRMALWMSNRQHTNGYWRVGKRSTGMILPTSMEARMEALPKRDPSDRKRIMNRAGAHARYNWTHGSHFRNAYQGNFDVLATSLALIHLSAGAHPPLATLSLTPESPPSFIPEQTLREFSNRTEVDWHYVEIDPDNPFSLTQLDLAPVLFLHGDGNQPPRAELQSRLRDFIQRGGIVIAHAEANQTGQQFLDTAGPWLTDLVENGQVSDVSGAEPVLGDIAGRLGTRALKGIQRPDGAPAVLLMAVAERVAPSAGAFRVPEAVHVIATVLQRNLNDTLLSPSYAHRLHDLGSPDEVHEHAMSILWGAPEPAPPAVVPAKAEPTPGETPEPEEAPQPEDREDPAPVATPPPPPPEPKPRAPAPDEVW